MVVKGEYRYNPVHMIILVLIYLVCLEVLRVLGLNKYVVEIIVDNVHLIMLGVVLVGVTIAVIERVKIRKHHRKPEN